MADFDPSHLQQISNFLLNSDSFNCEEKERIINEVKDDGEEDNIDCKFHNQCLYRSIINRSYYAAFSYFKIWAINNKNYDEDQALAYYRRRNRNGRPPGRHKVLTLFILDNSNPQYERNIVELANDLDTIRENRTNADYVFDLDLSKVDAEQTYNISQNIIATL